MNQYVQHRSNAGNLHIDRICVNFPFIPEITKLVNILNFPIAINGFMVYYV